MPTVTVQIPAVEADEPTYSTVTEETDGREAETRSATRSIKFKQGDDQCATRKEYDLQMVENDLNDYHENMHPLRDP